MPALLALLLMAPPIPAACPGQPAPASYAAAGGARFREPVFANVDVRRDIPYGEAVTDAGERQTLLLDIFEPAGDTSPLRPAILWLHGGSFRPEYTKDNRGITAAASLFARYGYVGVNIEYRARRDEVRPMAHTIEDGMRDVAQAIEWVRRHAAEYRLDAGHIAIAGQSAGALLAGSFTSALNLEGAPRDRKGIFAQALFWGWPFSPHFPALRPRIDPCYPPTVFLAGNQDGAAPYTSALEMARELGAAGVARRVQIVEEGTHSLTGREEEYVPMAARFLFERLAGRRPGVPGAYEAEQYSKMLNAAFAKAEPGYRGSGYIEMSEGAYVEWDYVGAPAAGPYRLAVRYANPSSGPATCRVLVNGNAAEPLVLGPAGAWSAARIEAALRPGENTVRLACGPVRIDALEVAAK